MTEQEKLAALEDIMELDAGTLSAGDTLSDYPEWDSITALTFISYMDENFHKTVTGAEIKAFVKVSDVLKVME